ncbi:hypothetical protein TNCV_993901 [Trichonephila clavipes]|nr:hypothetical protein TNCV_993901 [Trichonephila clavipes]
MASSEQKVLGNKCNRENFKRGESRNIELLIKAHKEALVSCPGAVHKNRVKQNSKQKLKEKVGQCRQQVWEDHLPFPLDAEDGPFGEQLEHSGKGSRISALNGPNGVALE